MISSARREDIVSALRRGTVPSSGLDALAVGIDTFAPTLDDELESVSAGRGGFKAVRGEYGTGKTFALVQAACDEQDNERRVIFAVFSKDQIPEVADRFRKAKTMVRLRVITGRDESNCWNYSAR